VPPLIGNQLVDKPGGCGLRRQAEQCYRRLDAVLAEMTDTNHSNEETAS
jgi:hypothetical protein